MVQFWEKEKHKASLEFGREYPSLDLGLGRSTAWRPIVTGPSDRPLGSTVHTWLFFLGYLYQHCFPMFFFLPSL